MHRPLLNDLPKDKIKIKLGKKTHISRDAFLFAFYMMVKDKRFY